MRQITAVRRSLLRPSPALCPPVISKVQKNPSVFDPLKRAIGFPVKETWKMQYRPIEHERRSIYERYVRLVESDTWEDIKDKVYWSIMIFMGVTTLYMLLPMVFGFRKRQARREQIKKIQEEMSTLSDEELVFQIFADEQRRRFTNSDTNLGDGSGERSCPVL